MTILETAPARPLRSPSGAAVSVDGVSKVFGHGASRVVALDAIDIKVAPGEFVCVVGASGCGKTTLLNVIAGLEDPTAGRIDVNGRCALMFQESALFPWLTAAKNVELALRLQGVGRRPRVAKAEALLELVHLGGFGDRRPHELSGGMRQRVALARAFAQDADVLLMDEPFGALDAMTRDLLHDELERIVKDTGVSVLFVTHNVREAARLADRVLLLTSRPGRVAAEFDVDVARPRRIESPQVSSLASKITDRLRAEVARHGRR